MTGDKRDYLLLSPAELRMYDLVLAQLIFMDSLQTNNLMDNINPYITAPEVNACLSRQSYEEANHCLIEGTEILTDRGFIDFRELTYEDKVANYYHNGRIFFNYPKEIIHNKFKGDLIEFSMHNYKQIVTPNHRMVMRYPYYKRVIEKDRGKIKIEVAEHASLGNYDIPVAGYNIGQTSTLNIIDRLGIIYQADGTPVNNFNNTKHGYCYRFSFKREDKINRLNQILNSNGIKHTKKISDSGYTHFYVWINFRYDKEFSWITIDDKSSEYISSFIEELGYWDGSIRRKANNNILYTNTNRKAVDKVVALATIGGCQTGIYRMEPSDNNNNKITAYQVYIAIGKDHKTGREINKSKIPYDGMTYCCTVDSGMIICRYEDNVFVTGNSKSYAVMVESISDNTDLIYDMWKTDDKLREKNTYIASVYEELSKGELTDTKLLLALFANQILEGIYFYAGFAALYALGKSGKMLGTTQMIRFINKCDFE